MATRDDQRKILLAAFDGPTLKTPYRCKDLANISNRNRVIAHFVPNFVVMASRESHNKISLAAFDGTIPKIPIDAKISQISLAETELWPILSQISLPWQTGRVEGKFE